MPNPHPTHPQTRPNAPIAPTAWKQQPATHPRKTNQAPQ